MKETISTVAEHTLAEAGLHLEARRVKQALGMCPNTGPSGRPAPCLRLTGIKAIHIHPSRCATDPYTAISHNKSPQRPRFPFPFHPLGASRIRSPPRAWRGLPAAPPSWLLLRRALLPRCHLYVAHAALPT